LNQYFGAISAEQHVPLVYSQHVTRDSMDWVVSWHPQDPVRRTDSTESLEKDAGCIVAEGTLECSKWHILR